MKVNINPLLKEKLNEFDVIAYTMDVDNLCTAEVCEYFNQVIINNQNLYSLEEIIQDPKIKESRDGYKKLGKDPSHTRVACENLWRRMIKKQPFYHINDIVDLGNILSLLTKRSVCVVDLDKIKGDVTINVGRNTDIYETINRGLLNVTNIPVYEDEISLFGCPSSDTKRTVVTSDTKRILVMIICFSNKDKENDEKLLKDIYKKYAGAKNLTKIR